VYVVAEKKVLGVDLLEFREIESVVLVVMVVVYIGRRSTK